MSSINFPIAGVTAVGGSNSISVTNTSGGIVYTNTSGTLTILQTPKKTYNVLGREVEIEGYQDYNLPLILSLINTLGIKFYVESKKNDINLPVEIEKILEEELISYSRNETIEKIIKEE